MIVTFKGLYDQVLRSLGDQDDEGNVKAVAKDYINQAQQIRLAEYPWPFMLWDTTESFTCTSATAYPLHSEYARPFYFYNRTKGQYLTEVPFRNIEPQGHSSSTTDSSFFSIVGRTPVQYQPSSASRIALRSTSILDTGSDYKVVIKGIDDDGNALSQIVTLTGTSVVNTAATFTKILAVTKSGEFNGTLTLTSNTASITNLTLLPTEMGRSYPLLQFHGSPTVGDIIEYRFYRQPFILINDYDVPEIPPPYCEILVWDALMSFAAYNGEMASAPLWQNMQKRWEDSMGKAFNEAQTLGAQAQFIRTVSDPYDSPELY